MTNWPPWKAPEKTGLPADRERRPPACVRRRTAFLCLLRQRRSKSGTVGISLQRCRSGGQKVPALPAVRPAEQGRSGAVDPMRGGSVPLALSTVNSQRLQQSIVFHRLSRPAGVPAGRLGLPACMLRVGYQAREAGKPPRAAPWAERSAGALSP